VKKIILAFARCATPWEINANIQKSASILEFNHNTIFCFSHVEKALGDLGLEVHVGKCDLSFIRPVKDTTLKRTDQYGL